MPNYRAAAAQCRDMAMTCDQDNREYWLKMERFWLSKAEETEHPHKEPV
ncbi:MAG TPA: hypothetical protein VFA57_11830 [Pseudolabrys sp.]|nr:hypothetical protein [Pseudolabrys sp.]